MDVPDPLCAASPSRASRSRPSPPPSALADNSSTLTVLDTSDVEDLNVIRSVVEPGFEARYPQYTLNHVRTGRPGARAAHRPRFSLTGEAAGTGS